MCSKTFISGFDCREYLEVSNVTCYAICLDVCTIRAYITLVLKEFCVCSNKRANVSLLKSPDCRQLVFLVGLLLLFFMPAHIDDDDLMKLSCFFHRLDSASAMGRRKSKRKPPPKKKMTGDLDSQFTCPFCNHEKSCDVKM